MDESDWPLILNPANPNPADDIADHRVVALIPLPEGSDGMDAAGQEAVANARLFLAAPDLLAACEALHDALSNILENVASADRDGEIEHAHGNEYEIGRDMRAQSHWAIRKSFKALVKAKGEP